MQGNGYRPSDDTFLLAGCLEGAAGGAALEVGTGSGYIAKLLGKSFGLVVATDLDIDAVKHAMQGSDNVSFVCCDCCSAISGIEFDLIVVNPPYLPSGEISDIAVDGGAQGIGVTLRMVDDCIRLLKHGGRMLVVSSSLANYPALVERLESMGLRVKIIAEKELDFERLVVIEASHATPRGARPRQSP